METKDWYFEIAYHLPVLFLIIDVLVSRAIYPCTHLLLPFIMSGLYMIGNFGWYKHDGDSLYDDFDWGEIDTAWKVAVAIITTVMVWVLIMILTTVRYCLT